LKLCIHSNV